ncbi:MAG: mannosyltransferase [Bacteroidetes bacterium]|nr:MAG: mannosyltransferase [Bacteroidota bacterium]
MLPKQLHIVAFNVPYPPDYGGVIDLYYKMKALHDAGAAIHLHCFSYGRPVAKELKLLCERVYDHPRHSGLRYLLAKRPYVVATRNANTVPEILLKDEYPVLFEGLHTTASLQACSEAGKTCLVRAHNIEHAYYKGLAQAEKRADKRFYFHMEARKLQRYEPILKKADHILAISSSEAAYFESQYGNTTLIPAFHKFGQVASLRGSGTYILFHGNLGVVENQRALLYLLNGPLGSGKHPLVVAGKNPGRAIRHKLSGLKNCRLHANPGDEQLEALIRNAHINLLYTHQATGLKLKLLHALFAGRHCMVNPEMVQGSGLEKLCLLYRNNHELELLTDEYMNRPFEEADTAKRTRVLGDYDNVRNAQKLLSLLP